MTIFTTKRIGALALIAVVALSACSNSGSSPSTAASAAPTSAARAIDSREWRTRHRGRSSSTAPARSSRSPRPSAEDFNAANPGVDVSVKESGTGGGFTKFCAGETDINDASRPIKEDDAKEGAACKTNGITYVQLQVAIDGLTVVVNPANTLATCLTLEQLKTIYGPGLAGEPDLEPGRPELPEPAGRPLHAGRGLGDVRLLHRGRQRRGRRVDPACASSPRMTTSSCPSVAGDPNAISYFGYAYYVAEQRQAQGRRRSTAARAASRRPTTTIGDGTYAPLSRPLFIYPNTAKAKESPALYEFVNFYLANAATLAAEPTRLHRGPG